MSGFGGLRPLIPAHQALEREQAPPASVEPATTPPEPAALPPPPERLQAGLKALRWTYGTLAVELRTSPSTTRNWGLGRSPVPLSILRWVELLAEFHRQVPAPPLREREP